ncbi:MAG: PDZ domain-containing protein [Oscillospiraceae bacterium]|nr:PDZ domain-containing protein [Oscillospiraceae bacterium]
MNKKISIGITISIAFITAAITMILTWYLSQQNFNSKITNLKERAEKYSQLENFDTIVRSNFNGTIDETALLDAIFNGYVSGLDDRYARYYTAEEYQSRLLEDSGELFGIGVTVSQDESGYIRIVGVNEDSPAKSSGIEIGDLIIAVGGNDVLETGYSASIDSIAKGEEGSEIELLINRGGDELTITVTRRTMEITSVTGQMLDGNIAYIKIDSFNEKTGTQFSQVLYKLLNDGAERIIFDVRNNGGGLVSAVDEVLEDILPKGEVAFATYNDGEQVSIVTMENDNQITIPMVVLVNNSTASGGELFAQSLRDFASVPLVGVTTYGKGVMQTTYELEGGGAVTITVATYQTTKTDCYDGIGIAPDFEVELSEEAQSYIEGVDVENDFQLIKAIEVVTTG